MVKPVLLYGCQIWGPELLSYKTHFDKSTIEQVHIKFCKQILNTPWYTENVACRAELGRHPLSVDIKAAIFNNWQRLNYETNNPLLREAFQYATKQRSSFSVFSSDVIVPNNFTQETVTLQNLKTARSNMKKKLRNEYIQQWLVSKSSSSLDSRQKFTHKEIKQDYQIEDYLEKIGNPTHRVSLTKLRLGAHSLRIQTGKYENGGTPIPVEHRTCLVCKTNAIEDEQHFLMCCQGYHDIRRDFHSIVKRVDNCFEALNDHDKIKYILKAGNQNTCKIIGKYIYLMLQKRKEILNCN